MQVLFVHPNYPAQFGPLLRRLALERDVECVFVSSAAEGLRDGVRCIRYAVRGGATASTHYCARTFENAVWSAHSVYEICKATPGLHPDLIVGHSGFGTTLFLRELYRAPVVNYFEYFYSPRGSDLDFRPEFPPQEIDRLRSLARNAMILLDLENAAAGYSPTHWQRSLFPEPLRAKIEVLHDGVDTEFWCRRALERQISGEPIPGGTRIVTYVSRGLESMRGFDLFVRVAKRIAARRSDVLFVVVGSDRVRYGGDLRHIREGSFKEHVLRAEQPDLSRFRFLGSVPAEQLAGILSLSDLHIYLTVPFVLSWSLLDAMACCCPIVASDTAPVREVIRHGENGLLAGFYDVDGLAAQALELLEDRERARALGEAARREVVKSFALDRAYPELWQFLQRAARRGAQEGGANG